MHAYGGFVSAPVVYHIKDDSLTSAFLSVCVCVYALSTATNSSTYFLSIFVFHSLSLKSGKWLSIVQHLFEQ